MSDLLDFGSEVLGLHAGQVRIAQSGEFESFLYWHRDFSLSLGDNSVSDHWCYILKATGPCQSHMVTHETYGCTHKNSYHQDVRWLAEGTGSWALVFTSNEGRKMQIFKMCSLDGSRLEVQPCFHMSQHLENIGTTPIFYAKVSDPEIYVFFHPRCAIMVPYGVGLAARMV